MLFDLLEVGVQRCCTCGYLSEGLATQGVITGPFIHGRTSVHFELTCDRVLEWLAWLIRNGRANVLVLAVGCQDPTRPPSSATSPGPDGLKHGTPAEEVADSQAPPTYVASLPEKRLLFLARLARECQRSAVLCSSDVP